MWQRCVMSQILALVLKNILIPCCMANVKVIYANMLTNICIVTAITLRHKKDKKHRICPGCYESTITSYSNFLWCIGTVQSTCFPICSFIWIIEIYFYISLFCDTSAMNVDPYNFSRLMDSLLLRKLVYIQTRFLYTVES